MYETRQMYEKPVKCKITNVYIVMMIYIIIYIKVGGIPTRMCVEKKSVPGAHNNNNNNIRL